MSLKLYNYFLLFLATVNIAPLLAPVFARLGEQIGFFDIPAKAIYFIYSFTCHQFNHRSLYLFDYQYAWCARDTGIWFGILLAALIIRKWKLNGIRWYWVFPFVIPIALDGGIQTIGTMFGLDSSMRVSADVLYISTNPLRFITGALFGIGISLFLSPVILNINLDMTLKKFKAKYFAAMFSVVLITYVILVSAWSLTSSKNLPIDALDSGVKTPEGSLFERRVDGLCPSTLENILATDCFFQGDQR